MSSITHTYGLCFLDNIYSSDQAMVGIAITLRDMYQCQAAKLKKGDIQSRLAKD